MKRQSKYLVAKNRKRQAGTTLIETLIALAILFVVATGVLGLAVVALSTTETQGHLGARTAEYSQDKMEQLLALQFPNTCTDTTVFPSVVNCATGTGLIPGGSLDPTAPVAGYSDFVDLNGNIVAAGGKYVRVWRIDLVTPSMKRISVLTQVTSVVGSGALPQSTVVALKSSPF
jgi:pilin/secretion family protein with methylation motif